MTSGASRASRGSHDMTNPTARSKPAPRPKPKAARAGASRSVTSALVGVSVVVVATGVGVRRLWHAGDVADSPQPASKPGGQATRPSGGLQSLAARIEREARQRPDDPAIATETAGAYVAFGDVLKGTQWYIEALRRQVGLAGGSAAQLEAVDGYGCLHLAVHLEIHAIQLARQLLRTPAEGQEDYVRQLEARCGGATALTTQMTAALRTKLGVPRQLLAGALAHCAHTQGAMSEWARGAVRMHMGRNGLMHLLAHFGDAALINDTMAALPRDEVVKQLHGRATLAHATPVRIAEGRGYSAAAAALRRAMDGGDATGAGTDTGGGSTADTGGGSAADTGRGWVRVTPPLQMSEAQRGSLVEAVATHGGWGNAAMPGVSQASTVGESEGGVSAGEDGVASATNGDDVDDCHIDVVHVDSLSPAAFATHFYATERPVLIRNGSAPHWRELRSLLSVSELTLRHGQMGVRVSANPYHDGQQASRTSLAGFVTQVAAGEAGGLYLFESLPPSPLRSALEPHLPAFVTAATGSDWADQHSVQLAIGGAGTGAPAHYHKAAVNSLIYGQKRWWLWPPAHAQYSAMPVGEWVAAGGPEAAAGEGRPPLSCVQRAGDVLYLPDFWGHAVLNQKPSVAVATEILTQRLQFFFAG